MRDYLIDDIQEIIDGRDAIIAALRAELEKAQEALNEAEAVFSIVEPRSDKAEYLRVLGVVRAALKGKGEEVNNLKSFGKS